MNIKEMAPTVYRLSSLCKKTRESNHLQMSFQRQQIKENIQKFGFINGVDNVNWPPYRDSKG